jgi:hypothetical protein
MKMLRKKLGIAAVGSILLALGILSVHAQKDLTVIEKIGQLANEFHYAEITWDATKMESLVTSDFVEDRTDGRGTQTRRRARILSDLRGENLPENLKEVFSKQINSLNELTDISVQRSGRGARFQYKLTERRSLKIPNENPPTEFMRIERFDVSGTAVHRNGKWLLVSLAKTFMPNKQTKEGKEELDAAIKFDLALAVLMAETLKKK